MGSARARIALVLAAILVRAGTVNPHTRQPNAFQMGAAAGAGTANRKTLVGASPWHAGAGVAQTSKVGDVGITAIRVFWDALVGTIARDTLAGITVAFQMGAAFILNS